MYLSNPYRRRKSSADVLEYEEYEDEEDGIGGSMETLGAYELNPRRACARCGSSHCGCGCGGDSRRCSCRVSRNPGRGPLQRSFGPGGGYMDDDGWHAGGGRYLDPGYLPARYPDGVYHAGGGQVNRGFHAGSGYFSNNPGSILDQAYQSPYSRNPGRGPLQRSFGPGGGYMDDDGWHAGGGRYLDPGYLPARYPDGVYHAGGGQVNRGFHAGSGYFSNNPGSILDQAYQSPYSQNPLRRPPRDPRMVPAFNNPPVGDYQRRQAARRADRLVGKHVRDPGLVLAGLQPRRGPEHKANVEFRRLMKSTSDRDMEFLVEAAWANMNLRQKQSFLRESME